MSNPTSNNNFENQCFNPFEKNSVLLDNLSDPDFNFFNDNNLRMIDTQYFSPDDISTQLITSSENSFSVLHVNIRSISKNFEKLKDLLANIDFKFKIICLTETWCKDEDVKNNSLFQIPNSPFPLFFKFEKHCGGCVQKKSCFCQIVLFE